MGLVLRVAVLRGRNLAPKDKSGTSDPYLVITMGDAKQATSVVSKTLNPEWNQTFELPVTAADSALLEAMCWDKDRFKKDYMGEFDILIEDLFAAGTTMPEAKWFKLEGRRNGRKKKKDSNVSGEVLLKFTLFDPLNTAASPQQVLQKFYGVVADLDDNDEDADTLSRLDSRDLDDVSEEEDDDRNRSDETDDGPRTPGGSPAPDTKKYRRRQKLKKLKRRAKAKAFEFSGVSDVAGVLFLEINKITDLPPERNMARTGFDMDPFVVTSLGKKTYRTKVLSHNLNPVYDEKLVFQVQKHELNYSLSFAVVDRDKFSGNDFVGTSLFPVEKVRSLAPEADKVTGLYKLPDPDAIRDSDTQKRKWRVPMSRTSSQTNLNGRLSRSGSQTNLSSLKLTRSTSNSSLNKFGSPPSANNSKLSLLRQDSDPSTMMESTRQPPTSAGTQSANANVMPVPSHQQNEDGSDESGLYYYELPLDMKNKSKWEDKHNPTLYIRAKYLPYRALRQQFWRVMLKQYDADESGRIDKVELVTMLDTMGSTLRNRTINEWFRRYRVENGNPEDEFLTMDQAVICLEETLMLNKQASKEPTAGPGTSTASLGVERNGNMSSSEEQSPYMAGSSVSNFSTSTTAIPTLEVADLSVNDGGLTGDRLPDDDLAEEDDLANDDDDDESREEHVVEIHECPICHLPRLTRKKGTTDADIITHIATCASSDWRAVNNLVMAGFVTGAQAQRKWYSKIITKVRPLVFGNHCSC